MKNLYKQKRAQGFTIIEVMIVLAIAAVILLIVLLAVPALQRNSRNTQRNNDAAQFAAAVTTCLANQNGDVSQCQAIGTGNVDLQLNGANEVVKFGQLTTRPVYVGSGTPDGDTNSIEWSFKYDCDGNNPTPSGGGSNRSFAVAFKIETTGSPTQRCISS